MASKDFPAKGGIEVEDGPAVYKQSIACFNPGAPGWTEIKLFDLRLIQKGDIQSYAGHVNSHTHLPLVDPSKTLHMSGKFIQLYTLPWAFLSYTAMNIVL